MPPTHPTAAQTKVLRWLQDQTVRAREIRQQETQRELLGEPPAPLIYQQMHHNALLRHELQNAALAGGVPHAWLDHIRERAGKGIRWRSDLYLRNPEPVDRHQLLGVLTTEVHRLRQHIATAVGYSHIGAAREAGTATAFDRNLRTLWNRTAAVTALLTADPDEIARVWGHTSDWKTAVTSTLATTRSDVLAQRWRSLARVDTSSYKLQADVLTAAGITTDAVPIPGPATLISQFRTLQHYQERMSLNPGQHAGSMIDAAISAMEPTATNQPHQSPSVDLPEPGVWVTETELSPGHQISPNPESER